MTEQVHRQSNIKISLQDGSDTLPEILFGGMTGTEKLGRPFEYEAMIYTKDSGHPSNPTLLGHGNVHKMLGSSACVSLLYNPHAMTHKKRYFHGEIIKVAFDGLIPGAGAARYKLTLVPKVSLLQLNRISRIFHDQSVPMILKSVLTNGGLGMNTDLKFDMNFSEYGLRNQTIQYEESDFDFIHRLMEEDGISYHFEHFEDHHCMVVTDRWTTVKSIYHPTDSGGKNQKQEDPPLRFNHPSHWEKGHTGVWDIQFSTSMQIQSIHGTHYDHYNAGHHYEIDCKVQTDADEYAKDRPWLKAYYMPAGHMVKMENQSKDIWTGDSAKSKVKMMEILAHRRYIEAEKRQQAGNHRHLQCGYKFSLSDHPIRTANQEYRIIAAEYEIGTEDHPHMPKSQDGVGVPEHIFSCQYEVLPIGNAFVPELKTPVPHISGVHPAVVVHEVSESELDNTGSKMSVDTNELGEVQVQYKWSNPAIALDKNNPHQISRSVRVSQFWAGKSRGALFTPRVGDEVLVAFEYGHPNHPVVVGSVYNSVNEPFIDPKEAPLVSGIRSRTMQENSSSVPSGYKGTHHSDLLFNDDCEDHHTGAQFRIFMNDAGEGYSFVHGKNPNQVENAAGIIMVSPEEDSNFLTMGINVGYDVFTQYTGNKAFDKEELLAKEILMQATALSSTKMNGMKVASTALETSLNGLISSAITSPLSTMKVDFHGAKIRSFFGQTTIKSGTSGLEYLDLVPRLVVPEKILEAVLTGEVFTDSDAYRKTHGVMGDIWLVQSKISLSNLKAIGSLSPKSLYGTAKSGLEKVVNTIKSKLPKVITQQKTHGTIVVGGGNISLDTDGKMGKKQSSQIFMEPDIVFSKVNKNPAEFAVSYLHGATFGYSAKGEVGFSNYRLSGSGAQINVMDETVQQTWSKEQIGMIVDDDVTFGMSAVSINMGINEGTTYIELGETGIAAEVDEGAAALNVAAEGSNLTVGTDGLTIEEGMVSLASLAGNTAINGLEVQINTPGEDAADEAVDAGEDAVDDVEEEGADAELEAVVESTAAEMLAAEAEMTVKATAYFEEQDEIQAEE